MTSPLGPGPARPALRRLALAGLLAWPLVSGGGGAALAATGSELTPLAEAQLFISPCGKPFRSKPGEPYPVVAWFRETDANHDGRIDRAEFRAEAASFFHTLDRNGDGALTDSDIAYYEREMVPEISAGIQNGALGGRRDRLQPPLIRVQMAIPPPVDPGADTSGDDTRTPKASESDGPPEGAAPYELLNDPEPIRSADRRLVGRVTLADFLARADQNFDSLDPDRRGYLTLEDLPRTPVQALARPARRR